MMVPRQLDRNRGNDFPGAPADALPALAEYCYYAILLYGVMGTAWGLSAPFIGAGALAALAAFCVMRLGSRTMIVYKPIIFPVSCAISVLFIQIAYHGEDLLGEYGRLFFTWILGLIVVHSVSLRHDFLRRFALVALVIGLAALPSLEFETSGHQRAMLDEAVSGDLSNPNGLGAWFGFCCVYFTIVGLETKSTLTRAGSWLVALACLFVVGLTVSRGSLLAVALAIIVAFRRILRRGFAPALLLGVLISGVYVSGVFDEAVASYSERGTEETGRFLVWPLAFERFISSPVMGVGATQSGTFVYEKGRLITPHNSFLFIALVSGVVPLIFFLAYWWRAARGAFSSNVEGKSEAPFTIPLFIYAFMVASFSNVPFMVPWMMATLSNALIFGKPPRMRKPTKRPVEQYEAVGSVRRLSSRH